MTRALPLLAALCVAAAACGAQARERQPTGLLRPVGGTQPTATYLSETPTLPPVVSKPTGTPTLPPVAATPTATLVSEVLSARQPTGAPALGGGTALALPTGVRVVRDGCASDGRCYPYNFYWAPTREVVMQPGEPVHKVQHELCHAHQHWMINGGEPLPPSDYDLESWYATGEGQSFAGAVAGLPWPWSHSAVNGLEDFAWTCAYWYVDPPFLLSASPERYHWAAANLP